MFETSKNLSPIKLGYSIFSFKYKVMNKMFGPVWQWKRIGDLKSIDSSMRKSFYSHKNKRKHER